jgi:nitroimidazol reductase NimA-like FMN-containing flavoprotein (pyridoxamine 5'-phosphate oxidase superfamily)
MEMPVQNTTQLRKILQELFATQSLAVLATQEEHQPYGSLVAFAATHDLKSLLFATTRETRKYGNLVRNPKVALVIDDRANRDTDFHRAIAVTAMGSVVEVKGSERQKLLELYLHKHPYLEEFASSPTCALVRVDVDTYFVVGQIQNVMQIPMKG